MEVLWCKSKIGNRMPNDFSAATVNRCVFFIYPLDMCNIPCENFLRNIYKKLLKPSLIFWNIDVQSQSGTGLPLWLLWGGWCSPQKIGVTLIVQYISNMHVSVTPFLAFLVMECVYSLAGACFSCSSALHNWSGQEVLLAPQRMPFRRGMTSSIRWPLTSWLMPCRLPLHPPRKNTCWMTSFSSAVTSMSCEHVPCVWYCTCFVFICQIRWGRHYLIKRVAGRRYRTLETSKDQVRRQDSYCPPGLLREIRNKCLSRVWNIVSS